MSTAAIRRVAKELKDLNNKPIREYVLVPLESNMLEVHFTMMGPEDSPYSNGLYHGRVLIPAEYPFAPPDVVLLTPNGRFETSKKVCLSVSSYHPEHWKATWGIGTILHSLRNFMLTPGTNGIASINYPEKKRRELANASRTFVCKDCGANVAEQWESMKNALPATDADKGELLPPMPPTPATDPAATPNKLAEGGEGSEESENKTPLPPMSLPAAESLNATPTPQRQAGEKLSYTPSCTTSPAMTPAPSADIQETMRMPPRSTEDTTSMSFNALTPADSSAYAHPTADSHLLNKIENSNGNNNDEGDQVPSVSFAVADSGSFKNASFPAPPGAPETVKTPARDAAPVEEIKPQQVEPAQRQEHQHEPVVAAPAPIPVRNVNANNNAMNRHPLHFEISISTIDRGIAISVAVFVIMLVKKIVFDEWFQVMQTINGLYERYME